MKRSLNQAETDEKELSPKLDRLRQLIQMEINYAFQNEDPHGYRFAHEIKEANNQAWKDFDALFGSVKEGENGI
jgi:hypothetical protein